MRLGIVRIPALEYVVDLDNRQMVDYAIDALIDDLREMGRDTDIATAVEEVSAPNLNEDNIPEFLQEYAQSLQEPEAELPAEETLNGLSEEEIPDETR